MRPPTGSPTRWRRTASAPRGRSATGGADHRVHAGGDQAAGGARPRPVACPAWLGRMALRHRPRLREGDTANSVSLWADLRPEWHEYNLTRVAAIPSILARIGFEGRH